MEFGFGIPTRGPMATPEGVAALAKKGEELGFAIISVSDHVIIPKAIASTYPYNESGTFMGSPSGECMEQLTLLTFLAGITSSARLLTSVMVVPHRPPVLTAKMLATIDVLSKGRLIVGCGVGWMREEFEAIGTPPYDKRGAVSDEYIRAFKELWTNDNPTFNGKYCSFANIAFAPKPVQKPHPPIWVGGRARWRCAAPGASPTPGTPSAATRASRWRRQRSLPTSLPVSSSTPRRLDAIRPPWILLTARTGTTTNRPRHCQTASAVP